MLLVRVVVHTTAKDTSNHNATKAQADISQNLNTVATACREAAEYFIAGGNVVNNEDSKAIADGITIGAIAITSVAEAAPNEKASVDPGIRDEQHTNKKAAATIIL